MCDEQERARVQEGEASDDEARFQVGLSLSLSLLPPPPKSTPLSSSLRMREALRQTSSLFLSLSHWQRMVPTFASCLPTAGLSLSLFLSYSFLPCLVLLLVFSSSRQQNISLPLILSLPPFFSLRSIIDTRTKSNSIKLKASSSSSSSSCKKETK